MRFHSVQTRISILAGLCLLTTALAVGTFSGIALRQTSTKAADETGSALAIGQATYMQAALRPYQQTAWSLARTFGGIHDPEVKLDLSREAAEGILKTVAGQQKPGTGVFSIWEVDAFDDMDLAYADTPGHDSTGRFISYQLRTPEETQRNTTPNYENDPAYQQAIASKQPVVAGPMPHPFEPDVQIVRLLSPIATEEGAYGVIGIDVPLAKLQTLADSLNAYEGTAGLVVSTTSGQLVAGSGYAEQTGTPITEHEQLAGLAENFPSDNTTNFLAGGLLWSTAPVQLEGMSEPWQLAVWIPQSQVYAASRHALTLQAGVAIGCTVVGLVLITFMAGRITRPLKPLVQRALEIAEGKLGGEPLAVSSKDEIGEVTTAINAMSESLTNIVTTVQQAADAVYDSSNAIADSSRTMASQMNDQAQQVVCVSSAVTEMSASIDEVAKKSSQASSDAKASGRTASEGGDVVANTITGMECIHQTVTSTAESVHALGERSEQIGQVISVINDIADQTNLLALNAAIEAARAGEHGRGFAVVADEVRKLADRTTTATGEVSDVIGAIQQETQATVSKMNTGAEQVSGGVNEANMAGECLSQIVASANEVALMVQSIAAAAEQQAVASEQVSRNIEEIAQSSQMTSTSADEAAQAAVDVISKADTLKQTVARFQLKTAAT